MNNVQTTGCLLIRSNKVLLLKLKGKDLWELPGGVVNSNTEPEQAVLQATKSLTGLDAEIIQQFDVLGYQDNGATVEEIIFECSLPENDTLQPADEIEEARWFSLQEAKEVALAEDARAVLSELH